MYICLYYIDCVYFSLHRFGDRYFTIEFAKHVMLLPSIFGRFYNVLCICSWSLHYHTCGIKRQLCQKISQMGSANSANQNCVFKCSIIGPVKPKLESKWWSGKQQFIYLATFLWITSSFCIDILTKCLTVVINKIIILVHVVRLSLEGKFNKLAVQHLYGWAC